MMAHMLTPRTLENRSLLSRIPGWFASGLITILLAFAVSYIGIQRGQSATETRLQTAERGDIREEREQRQQMIPRHEFDVAVKGIEDLIKEFKSNTERSLDELKTDMREIRGRTFQK